MNSITHAYSVLAFLLVIGCTLIGFPMSVFSQGNESAVITEELTSNSVENAASTTLQAIDIVPAAATVAASNKSTEVLTDPYPREELPGEQVFNDFVVGPGRFVIELEPGQSKTVEMVISNRMGEKKRFSFETEDTTGSTDGSQAIVLLGNQKGPYTLKDFIKIPQMQFDLESNQRVRVPVTVSLPKDAEPGGRYGSLLVSIVSDPLKLDEENGAKPGSVIVSRIGTLFFVTTPGALEQDGKLQKFSTAGDKKFYTDGPISFSIVSENFGTVHLTPSGEVKIYNMIGNEVGSAELDPWFVMPKSIRVREISWDRDFLMGRYTAIAKVDRGYNDLIDEQSYSFWVIPWKIIVVVFAGLFVFFLLIRFIFGQFEFKRKSK